MDFRNITDLANVDRPRFAETMLGAITQTIVVKIGEHVPGDVTIEQLPNAGRGSCLSKLRDGLQERSIAVEIDFKSSSV
ncbi:hypothetical protein Ciccas_014085, partial [Cichlidogyrus casuarinus]